MGRNGLCENGIYIGMSKLVIWICYLVLRVNDFASYYKSNNN